MDCWSASELSGFSGEAPYHMAENSLTLQPDKLIEASNIWIKGFASIKAFLMMPLPLIFAETRKICPCKSHVPEMAVSLVMETAEACTETKMKKKEKSFFKEQECWIVIGLHRNYKQGFLNHEGTKARWISNQWQLGLLNFMELRFKPVFS